MRCAIYLRVSTERQRDEGVSLDAQLAACRAEAIRLGDRDPAVYRDDGFSGTTDRRPGLQTLLGDLASYDVVIVWRLDRLWRSVAGWARLLGEMVEHGVGFCSITERIDASTPWGRAMLTVVAVFAELFVEILRENVRAALQYRADHGLPHGKPPYGYRVGDDGWEVVDDESAIVRELFRLAGSGRSVTELTRWMQASDAIPRTSKLGWHPSALSRILRNPSYTGRMVWHGEAIPGTHPRIITDVAWRRAQTTLDGRAWTRGRVSRTLIPLLRCGPCGGSMERFGKTLTCRARRLGHADHEANTAQYRSVVDAIWEHYGGLLTGGEMREAVELYRSEVEASSGRRGELTRRLRDLHSRETRTLALAQRTGADLDALAEALEPIVAERERLGAELRSSAPRPELDQWAHLLEATTGDVIERVRAGPVEGQLLALRAVIERCEVDGGRDVLTVHHIGEVLPPVEVPIRHHRSGRPAKPD